MKLNTGINTYREADSAMNQSQFLAITCNLLKAREKLRAHGAIGFGFGFASHSLKYWLESFKPITKRSNRNHLSTFFSHLKTALMLFIPTMLVKNKFVSVLMTS